MSSQYFYAVGKRKTAIARVKIFLQGKGNATVNGEPMKGYFTDMQTENALSPLRIAGQISTTDVEVQVLGGGKNGQSDAVRHGITRTLLLCSPEIRSELKRVGFLRRDSRIKERKKPGLRRARRAPQFSKR